MEKIAICRICLSTNTEHGPVGTQLQEIYEKLTAIPFQKSDMRPLVLCYICHGQLKASRRLMLKCLKAEELLTEMLNQLASCEEEGQIRTLVDRSSLVQLSITDIQQIIIHNADQNIDIDIKEEIPIIYEEDLKLEEQSTQDLPEMADSKDLESDNKYGPSDPGDDKPTNDTRKNIDIARPEVKVGVGRKTRTKVKQDLPETADSENLEPDNEHGPSDPGDDNKPTNNKRKNIDIARPEVKVGVGRKKRTKLKQATPDDVSESRDDMIYINTDTDKHGHSNACLPNGENFICDICQTSYTVKHDLLLHKRTHIGEKPYTCNVCNKGFNYKRHLQSHERIHTGEKPYVCNFCGKRFREKRCLSIHARVHTGEKPYVCHVCEKRFRYNRDFTDHMSVHTGIPRYACDVCGKGYIRKRDLINHISSHTGKTRYACDVCGKGYNQKDCLIRHGRLHKGEKPHVCNVCSKGFASRFNLRRHTRTHTGEKPYACNVCHKRFAVKVTLRNHTLTHTGEKPYVCNVCNKCFKMKISLQSHVRRIHSSEKPHDSGKGFNRKRDVIDHANAHTAGTRFVCEVCGKGYIHKIHLISHLRVHTGEKPFVCNICNKSFAYNASLILHAITHTGDKPYICHVCKKAFNKKYNLKKHEIIHTGEKPYRCNVCYKSFNQKCVLTIHARTHTGEKPYACSMCDKSFAERGTLTKHARIHKREH